MAMAAVMLSGCSALPQAPVRNVQYDFGPGILTEAPSPAPVTQAPLTLADVDAPGVPEGSTAVYYRLLYASAQQLRPYAEARWAQPPSVLLQQLLRNQLGQQRPVLTANDGAAQARVAGKQPTVLRIELDEFSHLFNAPSDSLALVRLRATLVEPAEDGERLVGQRVFIAKKAADTPDAAGGAKALADAAAQAVQDIAAWAGPLIK